MVQPVVERESKFQGERVRERTGERRNDEEKGKEWKKEERLKAGK